MFCIIFTTVTVVKYGRFDRNAGNDITSVNDVSRSDFQLIYEDSHLTLFIEMNSKTRAEMRVELERFLLARKRLWGGVYSPPAHNNSHSGDFKNQFGRMTPADRRGHFTSQKRAGSG